MNFWLLTSEHNAYDQHGEYFEAAFEQKPTEEKIMKAVGVNEACAKHILNGGGRQKYEDVWYNLRQEELQ